MLHTELCNLRTHVTHEIEMFSVRTYVMYGNILCPNLCHKRKYDVWCPKLYYIRKYTMSKPVCTRKYDDSCPNLYNNNYYVRIHVAQENMMSRVRPYVTSKMCYVRTYATHEYAITFCPN